jgi:hypothetical protein
MSDNKESDFKLIEFVSIELTSKGDKWCGTKTDGGKLYWSIKAKDGVTDRPLPPIGVKLSALTQKGKFLEYLNWFKEDTGTPHTEPLHIPESLQKAKMDALAANVFKPLPALIKQPEKPISLPSRYSDDDKLAFANKQLEIRRSCALNNATSMILALSNSLKFENMDNTTIKTFLDSERKRYYSEFMTLLSGVVPPLKGNHSEIDLAEEVGIEEEKIPF